MFPVLTALDTKCWALGKSGFKRLPFSSLKTYRAAKEDFKTMGIEVDPCSCWTTPFVQMLRDKNFKFLNKVF